MYTHLTKDRIFSLVSPEDNVFILPENSGIICRVFSVSVRACVCVYVKMYMLIMCVSLFSGLYLNGNLRVEFTWN